MSDILIKNMEMPDKATTIVIFSKGEARVFRHDIDHDEWLTAIEVPPHGRLIDADALDICKREQQAWQDYEHDPDNEYLEGVKDGLHEASKQLSSAMTIIDAEGTLNSIKSIPSADVAPVAHANWLSVGHKLSRICSRCYCDEPYKFADDNANVYDYCPHCGAKMDLN